MRRLFWVSLGAAAGVLTVRAISRKAERYRPASLAGPFADSVADLAEALRDFAADVRAGMAEREAELRAALGLDGTPDLEPETAAVLTRHPASPTRPASPGDTPLHSRTWSG